MDSVLQTLAENVCLGLLGSLVFASIFVLGISLFVMETVMGLRRKQKKTAGKVHIGNNICLDCSWKETRTEDLKGAVVSILNWCSKCKKRVFGVCNRTGMHHCNECGGNVT